MTKHSKGDLAQMQSLPLDAKIRMTKMRIQQWYDSWKRCKEGLGLGRVLDYIGVKY